MDFANNSFIFSRLFVIEFSFMISSSFSRPVVFYRPKWEEGEGIVDSKDIEEGLRKVREKVRVKIRVKTGEKILDLIKQNIHITAGELAQSINVSKKTIEWIIKQLKTKGKLRRIGPDKGGHWEVL